MNPVGPETEAVLYVARVLSVYVELPDTPLRAGLSDHALAHRLQARGVPYEVVETALLLGSLRRFIRPADALPLPRIRSLAYFQPVVEELLASPAPAPANYCEYLRRKLRRCCAEAELSKRYAE